MYTCTAAHNCRYMYSSPDMTVLIAHSAEDCEGWLSHGGHSSGGRALTAKARGPRFNPGWLPVFLSSLQIFLSLFIMYMYIVVACDGMRSWLCEGHLQKMVT